MTDLHYTDNGFFITLIANSKGGEYIWNEIANAFDGVAKFPIHMKASIFKQIKDAGYTIRKAPKVTNKQMDAIFKELEGLGV